MTARILRTLFVLVTAAVMYTSATTAASAQQMVDPARSYLASSYLGLGYVVNAPEQLLGFGASLGGEMLSGWGVYADVKLPVDRASGEDIFVESETAADARARGDDPFGEPDEAWTSFNVALVRALGHDVAVYAGAGYSDREVYQEFAREDERGPDRFYIVEDVQAGGESVNVLGGFFFRASRVIAFQVGGETAPAGFTAGVTFLVPLGR